MNKIKCKFALWTATFVMLTACQKDNLPQFNRLEGLRILAFQTNTPEVSPGATVTLNPVISDIHATSLNYSISACLDPGLSYGANPTCEGSASKVVIAANAALTLPGSGESWTGLADSFSVSVPTDAIIFAGRTQAEMFNGVNYLVIYSLTNNLGEQITAIKRILVSESAKTSKNQNPVTSQIFADGVAMTGLSYGAKVALSTDLVFASAEAFTAKNAKLESFARTEKLVTTWFVTDGETKYYRSSGTDSNLFTQPDVSPVGRSFYMLAITHDDRGGVSLVKKKF